MISSKDFEKLWFLYQTEGAPSGVSINSFCMQRGVPYNEFSKCIKILWRHSKRPRAISAF